MGIKKIKHTYLVLILLLVSCFNNKEKEKTIDSIKTFYIQYLKAKNENDYKLAGIIKNKFLTKNLINKIKKIELDYDPILNSQDVDIRWIDNIVINKDSINKNIYYLSYTNGAFFIKLVTIKDAKGFYKIDDIDDISQLYLNRIKNPNDSEFNEAESNLIVTKQSKKKESETIVKKQNDFLNLKNKIFKPYNSSCDIYITIYLDSTYLIKEKGKIKLKGKLKKTDEKDYYDFGKLGGYHYMDTLHIQNYGNSTNKYIHFKSCDDKYIQFVNILSKIKNKR